MQTAFTLYFTYFHQAYEDDDRRVRKAGVDVLVKLYQRLGEQLWAFMDGLSDAKVALLSAYTL